MPNTQVLRMGWVTLSIPGLRTHHILDLPCQYRGYLSCSVVTPSVLGLKGMSHEIDF
jgi:hypothetical protein